MKITNVLQYWDLESKVAGFSDRVRAAAADVMQRADFVSIDRYQIRDYAERLLAQYPIITSLETNNHFVSEAAPSKTAAYVLALDSINFGSGYFDGGLEYDKISNGLKQAFLRDEMNTPRKWRAVTSADFRRMFSIETDKYNDLLIAFAQNLRITGEMLKTYGDDPMVLIDSAEGSAEALAEIVGKWPHFYDVARYKGQEIPFFKRAQILAVDLHLAGVMPCMDMGQLTVFADNMVPHVLRCDGIIEYTPALAERIDIGDMIAAGSQEEIEIRAAAIHVVELMRWAVGGRVTSVNFDHILWHRGYEPGIYARPRHMTKSVWY
jgi:hypothetical protein